MSLQAKRVIATIRTSYIPDFEQRILETAGFPVKLDLDWASYGEDEALLQECQSAFFTAMMALKDVCRDQLGRDLAREGVRQVIVANAREFAAGLQDGTLTLSLPRGGAASVGYAPRVAEAIGRGL